MQVQVVYIKHGQAWNLLFKNSLLALYHRYKSPINRSLKFVTFIKNVITSTHKVPRKQKKKGFKLPALV